MRYARVKVHPMTLDSSTGQLRRFDDTSIVRSASSEGLELHDLRTRDTIRLGTDEVREYWNAPGGSEGFLILKSKIIVAKHAHAIVVPLQQ
jgi:hypothetical protein